MSDCRKFSATEANLSPEDRLAEVEKKFSIILERIKSYDEVLDKFKIIMQKLCKLEKDQEDLCKADKKISEDVAIFNSSLSSRIDGCFKFFEDHQRKCESQFIDLKKISNESLKAHIKPLKEIEEHLKEKIKKTCEAFVTKDALESYKKENCSEIKKLEIASNNSEEIINYVSESYNDLKTLQNNQSCRIDSITQQFKTIITDTIMKSKDLETSFNRMVEIVSTYATKDDIASSVKTLRNDLEGTPSSLEATKAEIIKKFEIASLDASNSVLKANNCVKQIELIERKIENLALLVKKYELSK